MGKIKNPNNNFFEAMLSNKEVVTDFLKSHLPMDIQEKLDFDSIKAEKDTFVSAELKKSETDILFSVSFDGKKGYIYILIEQQSKPDKTMPIRLQRYLLSAMEQHLSMQKGESLPIIIPLVLYNSKSSWNYPTGIVSMFDEDQRELAKKVLTDDFKLVNLQEISDDEIMRHNWASLLELSLKWAKERDIILLLEEFKPLLMLACRENQKVFFATLNYLVDVGETDKDKLIEWSKQNLEDAGEAIMTVANQWREEGIEQGIEQGVVKTARKMLKENYSPEDINKITDLPLEKIQKLQAKNQEDF